MSTSASISYQQLDALVTLILMTLENGLYNQRTEYSSVIAEKQGEKKQFQTVGKLYGMGNAVGRAAGDNITYDQSGLEYMVNSTIRFIHWHLLSLKKRLTMDKVTIC